MLNLHSEIFLCNNGGSFLKMWTELVFINYGFHDVRPTPVLLIIAFPLAFTFLVYERSSEVTVNEL